jgi:hypothetical protein
MRHILKLVLAVLLALTPLTAKTTSSKSHSTRTTTRKTTAIKKSRVAASKKTQHVSGYTTKNGKKVAPYKRRPPN